MPDTQPHTLAAILDLSRLVSSSLDLSVVLDRILTVARELSAADMVSVMLLDDSGERLRVVAAHGLSAALIADASFRLGEGIAGWVALHGTAVHTVNLSADPRYLPAFTPANSCIFVLPLRGRERTLGVLNLNGLGRTTLFSPEIVQMVEIFASHAAIAIENAAAVTSLRFAATRERIASLVQQATHDSDTVAPVARQLLAELGATLDDASCALYLPDDTGDYHPLAVASAKAGAVLAWRPTDLGAEVREARGPWGTELQVRVKLPDDRSGWITVGSERGDYLWRRAERNLVRFAADQVELLLRNELLVRQERQSHALSRTLSRLAAACNAMVGQATLLDFILEQLARFIAYDSAGVFLFHDDHYARMVAGRGFRFSDKNVVLYMGPGSLTWDVQQQRRALYVPDVQLTPGWQPVPGADIVRSWVGAPLAVNDHIIGMLTIDKWTPGAFSEADVQVAQLFAEHVAVAINNQQLLREAQTRAAQLQVLHQATVGIGSLRTPAALLDEVARLIHASFGYYQSYICLVEGDELVIQAMYGVLNGLEGLTSMPRYSVSIGLTGWVVRHNQTLLVNNVQADPRYFEHPQTPGARAELVVPISSAGRVLGVIAVQSAQPGVFSQSDVNLAEAVANLTAMSLEHLRREHELRSAQEQLVRNERLRALGELASGVAHDFNNLLASMLGHTQLLLAEQPDSSMADDLRVIERAALDGAATVRRLQSFAQTSRALPTEPVWLSEIIAESLALTRPRWRDAPQSQGVQIEIVREVAEMPAFAGDGAALRELVMNLIINAVDAMPSGGVLRLYAELLPAEQSPLGELTAMLKLSDTGVGMSEAVRARIFEPFFTTKGRAGTGMGLAMAYGIVQRHQGSISVQSQPGGGSSFTVLLPARPVPLEPGAPEQLPAPIPRKLRVLVVDDDETVRRVLIRQIQRMGHSVADAASGEAALAELHAAPYDLLCTDLGMPGMSGWDLIERARHAQPGLLTLLITGWGDQIEADEARARGADALLAKPFDVARLQQTLEDLHARRGANSALGDPCDDAA